MKIIRRQRATVPEGGTATPPLEPVHGRAFPGPPVAKGGWTAGLRYEVEGEFRQHRARVWREEPRS